MRAITTALVGLAFWGCEDSAEEVYKSELQMISIPDGMDFYFYCNANIAEPRNVEQYQNLLIFQHGGALDAADHFGAATEAIRKAGLSANTLVLSPNFEDRNARNNYYWTQFSWKDGRKSINAVPKISSYSLFDSLLLNHVLANYDQIQTIVVSGHSAGGQFVYRYAALSSLPDLVSQEVVYLPMNPSSVVYLGPERWNAAKERFEVPLNGPSCPGYEEWIYGISELSTNEYNRHLTLAEVQEAFPARRVVLATGTRDFGGDEDCEDLYQGAHRHERAVNVHNHVQTFFPENTHELLLVEGVDHDRDKMIKSPEVINFLNEVFN